MEDKMEKRISNHDLEICIAKWCEGLNPWNAARDLQDALRELERLERFHCDRVLSLESQRANQAEEIERLTDSSREWDVVEHTSKLGITTKVVQLSEAQSVTARLEARNAELVAALKCLIHRCEAEEVGIAWAPLTDARAAVAQEGT